MTSCSVFRHLPSVQQVFVLAAAGKGPEEQRHYSVLCDMSSSTASGTNLHMRWADAVDAWSQAQCSLQKLIELRLAGDSGQGGLSTRCCRYVSRPQALRHLRGLNLQCSICHHAGLC